MNNTKIISSFIFGIALVFLLASCGSSPEETDLTEDNAENSDHVQNDEYPKTLTVNEEEITIKQKPERIAVLSLDAAEAVLELNDADNVVAVPKSSTDESLSYKASAAAKVPHQMASATSLDPEQVLSFDTDLIIMTKLHHAEQDADQILQQAGIPLISLQTWNTFEHIYNNFELIGEAIGEQKRAEQIISDMKQKIEAVQKATKDTSKPSVLVISPLGPGTGPYFIGSSNIAYDIVRLAGGNNSADDLGLTRVTKASMEQIIKADPDYILLVQWKEGDDADIKEITSAPGWETLNAVKNGNTKTMTVKEIFYPNRYNADSVEHIAQWLHPEQFPSSQ